MGLGLQGAYGVEALQQAIRQRIQDQIAEQQRRREYAQQQFENDLKTKTFNQNTDLHRLTLQAMLDRSAEAKQSAESTITGQLRSRLSEGQSVQGLDPVNLARLRRDAATQQVPEGLPSVETRGFGTLPGPNQPAMAGRLQMIKRAASPAEETYVATPAQKIAAAEATRKGEKTSSDIEAAGTKVQQAQDRLDQSQKTADSQAQLRIAQIGLAQANAEAARARAANTGTPKPLAYQAVENLAGLNTAELEGVKILKQLRQSGLDQSNDPADPRWNKFVVTTLGVAPSDFNKADIQQRTAFVNAALTRGLMGARPSQYVAEIIQQHLPQGTQTGKQLAHVVHNVLEQTGERRAQVASLTGRKPEDIAPKGGDTYQQFLSGTGATDDAVQVGGFTVKVKKPGA